MKFIRKYFKQIICFAVIALFAVLFALNPSIATIAEGVYAAQTVQSAFESINMPISLVDLSKEGAQLSIPLITDKLSAKTYYIRVIDPIGKTHDCKVASGEITEDEYFKKSENSVIVKSLNNGIYNIVYFYNDTENSKYIYSYPYQVEVKGISYELDLIGEGKKVLVPSSAKNGQEIILPNAYVKIKGTDNYKMADGDNKLEITPVIVKDGATIFDLGAQPEKKSDEVVKIAEGENEGKYKLTPNLGEDEFATYRVYYRYLGGSDIPTKQYTINVSTDFEEPTELVIDKKAMPANIELGKKDIELPEITAHTEQDENVDYNITEIRIEKADNKNIYQVLTNNDRTFDMTVDAFTFDNGEEKSYANMINGNNTYKVTYKIESFYGLTAEKTFLIKGIDDNSKPEVFMAYSYDLKDGNWEVDETSKIPSLKPAEGKTDVTVAQNEDNEDDVNTDYSVELKSTYGFGELVFPAIYAKDLVNKYSDFTFVRYFQNKNDTQEKYYIDNIKLDDDNKVVAVEDTEDGYNASGDTNIGKFNKVVRFKFNNREQQVDGKTYTLHYYVIVNNNIITKDSKGDPKPQENNVYETGSKAYEFKVLNRASVGSTGKEDEVSYVSTPTIEIDDLSNETTITKTSNLSITVTSKDKYDTRLKNAMFYYQTAGSGSIEDAIKNSINDLIKSGVWDKDSEDLETETQDVDFSDFKCNVLDSAEFVSKMQTAGFTDFKAIEATSSKTFDLALDLASDEPVYLVAVTINDNNNIAVVTKKLVVSKTDEKNAPAATEPTAATVDEEGNELAGMTDAPNNIKYALDLNEEKTFEQGNKIYLPTVKFTDAEDESISAFVKYYILNEEKLTELGKFAEAEENAKIPTITYLNPSKVNYSYKSNETTISGGYITTGAPGTYYVLYTAIDDAGNQTFLTYSFKVVDTNAPILTVNVKDVTDVNNAKPISINDGKIEADINSVLNFEFVLKSNDGKDLTNSENTTFDNIKIVGTKTEYTPMRDKYGKYAFKFDTPDTYVVTISASHKFTKPKEVTKESNQVTFDVNITVPELTWASDMDVQSQAEIGETIYLPYITAQHGNSKIPVNVEVHVKDPDNKTPEYGDATIVNKDGTDYWSFKFNDNKKEEKTNFTTRGTYRITYTATSEYGSATSKVFDIKVGDSIAPTFKFASDKLATLRQDIVYDGTHPIEYSIDLVRYSTRSLKIKVTSNGKEIYNVDTGLQILDKNGTNTTAQAFLNWSNLTVELKTQDGNLTENTDTDLEKQYTINGVGKYTLVLTMTDNNNNTKTENISFNVISKTDAKDVNENVVGIVLIVVSLVILAGVILFFTFTGKKGGKGGSKRVKSSNKNAKQEVVSEKSDNESDAKTGEVE